MKTIAAVFVLLFIFTGVLVWALVLWDLLRLVVDIMDRKLTERRERAQSQTTGGQ